MRVKVDWIPTRSHHKKSHTFKSSASWEAPIVSNMSQLTMNTLNKIQVNPLNAVWSVPNYQYVPKIHHWLVLKESKKSANSKQTNYKAKVDDSWTCFQNDEAGGREHRNHHCNDRG
jgi:hypothetical protein